MATRPRRVGPGPDLVVVPMAEPMEPPIPLLPLALGGLRLPPGRVMACTAPPGKRVGVLLDEGMRERDSNEVEGGDAVRHATTHSTLARCDAGSLARSLT
jgi:hypothetical protein